MSSIYGIGASDSYFNSFFGNSSGGSSSSLNILGDYALIRNGTYKTLMNAYYKKTDKTSESEADDTEKAAEKKNLVSAKSSADVLKNSMETLSSTEFTEDNREEITKNVKSFVESYNSLIDTSTEVDTKSVLQNALWMTQITKANSSLLKEVGISIGDGNKLTLNEEELGKARLTTLDTLFNGTNSYADKISQKASKISKLATDNVVAGTSAALYTNKGDYQSISVGNILDLTA